MPDLHFSGYPQTYPQISHPKKGSYPQVIHRFSGVLKHKICAEATFLFTDQHRNDVDDANIGHNPPTNLGHVLFPIHTSIP